MRQYECPALKPSIVELTAERESHIAKRHPDLLPAYAAELAETVLDPDQVVPNLLQSNKRAFVKWFDRVRGGKFLVVQVVTDPGTEDRHWIVTAYLDSAPPA